MSSPAKWLGHRMSYTPIHGAYTELYAGLSPEISMDQSGGWGMSYIIDPVLQVVGTNSIHSDPLGSARKHSKRCCRSGENEGRRRKRDCREVLGLERGAGEVIPVIP